MNPLPADGSPPSSPPAQGSIWEGKIERIQPYGAFCSFGPVIRNESQAQDKYQRRQRRAWQGLVHISQLSATRVEKVEDVIDIDERVWVKIIEVERQDSHDFNDRNHSNSRTSPHAQPRFRIKLSMKDVSQDGMGLDLQQENEAKKQVTNQLETNLNSMIGMGVARDPMDRLILKSASSRNGNTASAKTVFRGGYTLVDDDEGEPESNDQSIAVPDAINNEHRTAPMGRGRGATLPAWMTRTEGPVGITSESPKISEPATKIAPDERYRDRDRRDGDSRQRSSSKSDMKKDRKRHSKRKRRREHGNRSRDRDYSDGNSTDASNSGSSRIYDAERRYRKHRKSRGHRRNEERGERQTSSKRKKDRKKRKSNRYERKYENSDDRSHRAKRHYKSDNSSYDHGSSDSKSSSSFR